MIRAISYHIASVLTRGSVAPRLKAMAPLRGLWWIEAYRTLLLVLILSYYGLLLGGTFELIHLGIWMIDWWVPLSLPFAVVGLAVVGMLVFLLGRRFYHDVLGLVTKRYDSAPEARAGIALAREEYPELYALVQQVGQEIAAPVPDVIRIAPNAECYVTEERKFAFRTCRKLTLVIGMPHLAVLSVAELKVILAHELAHFRMGDTTLSVFIFRFVETLRIAVAEFRGAWWRWINPIYWLCEFYRRMCLVLSIPIQRHLELRADSLSAIAFGGRFAASTLLNEWLLARQFDAAVATYVGFSADGLSPDDGNAYRWFADHWRKFSPEGQDYLLRRLGEEEQPSIFDSHPTMQSRVDVMRDFPPRITSNEEPAHGLVHHRAQVEALLQSDLLEPA